MRGRSCLRPVRGRWVARALVGAVAVAAGALTGGCGGSGLGLGGGSSLSVASQSRGVSLTPAVRTALYRSGDRNTADFIVSDMAREELDGLGVTNVRPEGVVVHVHMFLRPAAGRTPVEPTSSNATVTVFVFAGDAAGIYRGAGFFAPSGRGGGRSFGGRLAHADLRLSGASGYFSDRLGRSFASGRVRGDRDDAGVSALIDRLSVLSAQVPVVEEEVGAGE